MLFVKPLPFFRIKHNRNFEAAIDPSVPEITEFNLLLRLVDPYRKKRKLEKRKLDGGLTEPTVLPVFTIWTGKP